MQFLYQPLTWGFLLVLAPLAIHLINLMRQKRVEWGAMAFLLEAHRKHRKWIWLRQFLLLAMRMLLIAAVVAMLANLVTQRRWTALFGDHTTHHYVLLDDSYSMSDREGSVSAFDRGARAVGEFASRLMASDIPQKLSLIRFSQADRMAVFDDAEAITNAEQPTSPLDVNALIMDGEAEEVLAGARRQLEVSATAAGPLAAMQYASQLIKQNEGESAIVHLVSDFRKDTWQQASGNFEALKTLADAAADLELIDCVDQRNQNLTVGGLRPVDGTLAAGVPVLLEVEITNYGTETARQIPLYVTSTTATQELGSSQEMVPAVLIDEIPAGQTISREVQVFSSTPGPYVVSVQVKEDAVLVDNVRHCVIELPETVPVLVIDGDLQQRNATYFNTVFRPSQRVSTGVTPDVRELSYLTTATPETLANYHAIYLLDVSRVDQVARANLERYVRDGGGLGVFLGPNVDWTAYDDWHQDGSGVFPVRLTAPRMLSAANEGAGLVASSHPTLKVLAGDENPFASSIRFSRYFGIPMSELGPDVEVPARLQNGQPILVERRFGQGRVLVLLSTLAPEWNNWATQPSFVVFLLEMQGYLDSLQVTSVADAVGSPIWFEFDERLHHREINLRSPAIESSDGVTVQLDDLAAATGSDVRAPANGPESAAAKTRATLVAGPALAGQRSTYLPGIYEVSVRGLDGSPYLQRYAMNVEPNEGNLELSDRQQFAERLGREVRIVKASDVAMDEGGDDRFSWSQLLLVLLPLMLLSEQWLAYSASYHPRREASYA